MAVSVRQWKTEPASSSCRFRFSMAKFRFWWQTDGNFAGKLLDRLPNC
jgi:hypothetical protein